MSDKKSLFMKEAIRLSHEMMLAGHGGPFGAVIVKDGQIVGRGYNRVTSTNDPTAHAEVVAIRDACQQLNTFELDDCVLYTSCEPCPMCLAATYWARIPVIYYGNTKEDAQKIQFDDQWIYDELALPMSQRKMKMINLDRDDAQVAFKAWAEKSDKIEY